MNDNGCLTYSVLQASRLLGISENSLYRAVHRGEIPYLRIGKKILIPRRTLSEMVSNANGNSTQMQNNPYSISPEKTEVF